MRSTIEPIADERSRRSLKRMPAAAASTNEERLDDQALPRRIGPRPGVSMLVPAGHHREGGFAPKGPRSSSRLLRRRCRVNLPHPWPLVDPLFRGAVDQANDHLGGLWFLACDPSKDFPVIGAYFEPVIRARTEQPVEGLRPHHTAFVVTRVDVTHFSCGLVFGLVWSTHGWASLVLARHLFRRYANNRIQAMQL
jgi:hypothetical protein